jgi:hypothetical protein
MPANAIFCVDLSEDNIDFSGQSISIGSYITATNVVPPDPANDIFSCFEIIASDNPGSSGYTATTSVYSSCYDCLVSNYTVVNFESCDGLLGFNPVIAISEFGFVPSRDEVFYIEINNVGGAIEGTYTTCLRVSSVEQLNQTVYLREEANFFTINQIIFSNYSTCEECLNGFSAGTETNVCNVCWDGSGYTVSVVSNIPHPTWTNAQGQAVVQLNAITLGGPNGLNN